MNSKFFSTNVYGDITSNPYLPHKTVRFQKEILSEATHTKHYLNVSHQAVTETSQISRIKVYQNMRTDNSRDRQYTQPPSPFGNQLPIRYDRSYQKEKQYSPRPQTLEQNLVIKPLRNLDSTVKMQKSKHSKSGINLFKSQEFNSTTYSMMNSHADNLEKSHQQLDAMKHLAWKKCALDDDRCLGYNFHKEKENEVTVCFKGHVKRNYL